jgi:hypothetical protein
MYLSEKVLSLREEGWGRYVGAFSIYEQPKYKYAGSE